MANLYILNQYVTKTLSVGGGIDASQTTGIILNNTTGLDTTKPGIICLTWADPLVEADAEWITYTSIDGSNELQGVTRGAEGSTGKTHDNGAVIAFPVSESHVNQLAAGLAIGGDYTNGLQGVLDEDDFSSDSAVKAATQQSIKAYIDRNAGIDGWQTDTATWTYASATTFTVAGVDVTSQFTKGTRIKLTNDSSTKYFFVKSSTFSTDTTVTVFGGDDYSLASGAITNTFYSYQQNPQGYPTWFNYTPTYGGSASMTYTSVTTNEAKCQAEGNAMTVNIYAAGTTGGTASTELLASLPATSVNTNIRTGAYVRDVGDRVGYAAVTGSGNLRVFRADAANYGLGTNREIGALVTYEF